jgi:rubrerythrin
MLIHKLQIRDTLAIAHVALAFPTPLTLIAGDNGAGKSSLCEAIRLALLGELSRGLRHKKDMGALVRDGAKKGGIELSGEDWLTNTTLPAGAVKSSGAVPKGDALACCLTPDTYARMTPNDRKAFTLGLLDVGMGAAAIISRLLARDCHPDKAQTIKPIVERRGYQAAADYAAEQATEARGKWKGLTGETYGSQKAEGWLPTVPTPPDGTVNGLQQQIDALDTEVSALNQQIGAANATAQTVEGLSRRIADAAETAKLHARRTDALNAARKALAEAQETLAATRTKAEGGSVAPHWPCPECGTLLQQTPAALVPYSPPEVLADPQARAALPKLEAAVTLCERAVANAERDVKASDEAAALKVSLEEQLAAVPKDDVMVDVNGLRAKIAEQQDIRRTLVSHQTRIRDAETARLNAEQTRDLAAQAHRDVEQWVAIAEALQPDGIPGEILAEGIEPMNAALGHVHRVTADMAERSERWPLVQIAPDMSITYGGRPYGLCSESERYRADVMLALVIGDLSGIRFLLLDRVDVLSSRGRVALILLLHQLTAMADPPPIQVIALGTFKEPPKGLPTSSWTVRWIERGAIESTTTEAQEAA